MRVVVATDKFAGTLSAVEASRAMADGFAAAGAEVDVSPISDGGPGFVDAMTEAVGGERVELSVTGPLGVATPAALLRADDTWFIETAYACGLHLVPRQDRDPGVTTTYGVGELMTAALDAGARRLVLGLGGSATNDAGAGMLAALGARPVDALSKGPHALSTLESVDLAPARAKTAGVQILAATDVDSPLLGPHGASQVFAPQKGATPAQLPVLDQALAHFARLTDPTLAAVPGAGSAGGLAFGLSLVGGCTTSGVRYVLEAVGLAETIAGADLVVTGEGCFDHQSLRGKAPHGVASLARQYGVPCVVLAGRLRVRAADWRPHGFDEAHSLLDHAGADAMNDAARSLTALAADVGRRWISEAHAKT